MLIAATLVAQLWYTHRLLILLRAVCIVYRGSRDSRGTEMSALAREDVNVDPRRLLLYMHRKF